MKQNQQVSSKDFRTSDSESPHKEAAPRRIRDEGALALDVSKPYLSPCLPVIKVSSLPWFSEPLNCSLSQLVRVGFLPFAAQERPG